jgi:aspartate/methionine/tyrosine aminotransferase
MDLEPFLLDHWLAAHEHSATPIRYNLAASTGPRWTLGQLAQLGGGRSLDDVRISYAPSEGAPELRRAIADYHGVDPDWVVVTTGASEAASVLFCLASRPGGEIALPTPAFPAFATMAKAWRLGVRQYELRRDAGFRQSTDAVLRATSRDTVLALVNSPHNPTGSVMERGEIESLAAALKAHDIPLIADEVYHPIYFGADRPSAAGIDNVIVISDMSKALSLPGLRVGWIIDADAERRKRIIDARSYFTISGSPITEALAAHALRNCRAVLERARAVASANLACLEDLIGASSGLLSWVAPAGGTTAFPWLSDGRDSRPFCKALAAQGVLVAPGDCFGRPEHMRVGFAAQEEGYAEAVEIMRETLRAFGK